MDSKAKIAIINASDGSSWYPKGSERLEKSLNYHGYAHDLFIYKGWMNEKYSRNTPYAIKAAAISEVIDNNNYDIVLWLDCSVWAIDDPYKLIDIIGDRGYYFWKSGYNCAQTCSDKCLDYFSVSRDIAEQYTDLSSSIFGVHLGNPIGSEFLNTWLQSAKDGQFEGSRLHDGQSKDSRFLFHRQDQSCASIIANKLGLFIHDPNVHTGYYRQNNGSNIFVARGM